MTGQPVQPTRTCSQCGINQTSNKPMNKFWVFARRQIKEFMKEPEPVRLDIEHWESQEKDLSKTIMRSVLSLVATSIFCVMTLGESDALLIAKDARINLPVPSLTVPFSSFLLFSPLILFGIYGYAHVHLLHLKRLVLPKGAHYTPSLVNLPSFWARFITSAILYWMLPAVLGLFAWKALPRSEGLLMILATGTVSAVSTVLMFKSNLRQKFALRTIIFFIILFGSGSVVILASIQGAVILACQKPIPELVISRQINLHGVSLQQKDLSETRLKDALFSRAKLSEADLSFSTLSGANFFAADMSGVKARKANFALVKFDEAELSNSDLSYSTMYSASLRDANLRGAKLYRSDLSNADLQGADLRGADLVFADMRSAKLAGAELFEANLDRAILSSATGLSCTELTRATNWAKSYRDPGLSCGGSMSQGDTGGSGGDGGGNSGGGNGSLGTILCNAAVKRPIHVLFYLKSYFGLEQGWQGPAAKPVEWR